MTPQGCVNDRELDQLIQEVDRLFGEEATSAANLRAANTVDEDAEDWINLFHEAWKHELRQMLRRH